MKDLGRLGGANGSPVWLTDHGEVVGQPDVPKSSPNCAGDFCVHHAFLWKRGVMTDLGTLGSDPCSRALMSNSIVLPENVRRMLRQRLGSPYHIPGIVVPPRD